MMGGDLQGFLGSAEVGDPPLQLTGSNPVPHDRQESVQIHSGSGAFPIGVQATSQCSKTCILGSPACHGLQVGEYMGHSHSAWGEST